MNLTLNHDERVLLEKALDTRLRSLEDELVHTDDREYKRSVRETLDGLEVIAQRLRSLEQPPSAFPTPTNNPRLR